MKLKDQDNKFSLLAEVGRLDLVDAEIEDIPEVVYMGIIKKRRGPLKRFKDFRRSQISKSNWRKTRWKYLRGIRKFHRSVTGKRFHRNLARFLATRYLEAAPEKVDMLIENALKAVSSAKTHIYIEREYYMPLEEYVDFEIFCDYSIPMLSEIETQLYLDPQYELNEDQLELLLRIVDHNELIKAFSEISKSELIDVRSIWGDMNENLEVEDTTFLCTKFTLMVKSTINY